MLRNFFESDKVDGRKIDRSRDKFKPLVKYLRDGSGSTHDRNIEMLGWLLNYPFRPFDKNFDYVNTDPVITPGGGHEPSEPNSTGVTTPGNGTGNEGDEVEQPEPGEEKPPKTGDGKWWRWAAVLLFLLMGGTYFFANKEHAAIASQEQGMKAGELINEEQLPVENAAAAVLICKTSTSYAYHAATCIGLVQCKGATEKISMQVAKQAGRTPCGYCYPSATRYGNPFEFASKLVQCQGIAKTTGKRCKRMLKTGSYCAQHKPKP